MVALVIGGCVLGWSLERRRARRASLRRAIARRETIAVAALREGERAKIRGVVSAQEPLLTSPISGRACVGYRIEIDDASHDPELVWTPLVEREDWSSFRVADETGTVAVRGRFEMLVAPWDSGEGLPPTARALLVQDEVRMKELWGPRQFRFKETLLEEGHRVIVFGRPSVKGAPAMRGSEDEPVVVIDDDEPAG